MRQNSEVLAERVAEFKQDPEKVRQVSEFVDELILQAKRDAERKQSHNGVFDDNTSESGNLKRRLGRARGFVIRMFDALCNCTQTAAAAARNHAANIPFTKR